MSLFDKWNDKYGDKGLGDTLSRNIKAVTGGRIKECGGCKKRRDYLNNLLSYEEKCPNCK